MMSFDIIALMCGVSSTASQHELICVLFGIIPTVRETPFRSLRDSKGKIVTAIAKDGILSC